MRIFAFIAFFSALAFIPNASRASFKIDNLQKIIEQNRVTTIEELLPFVPAELREDYTLMYKNRPHEPQEASPLNPRAILYGTDARFVMAFNGDENQRGGNHLEVVQFSDELKSFEFYDLQFQKGRNPVISEKNPEKCLGCHRDPDPRPNWEPYSHWPGAYGSDEDSLSTAELTNLKGFFNVAKGHPRYSTLLKLQANYQDEPQEFSYPSNQKTRTKARANAKLTQRLTQLNLIRVANRIVNTEDYSSYRYAILGSLACSSILPSFFPDSLRPEVIENVKKGNSGFTDQKIIQRFRSIFESRGIETNDWFMSFISSMTNTFTTPLSQTTELVSQIILADPFLLSTYGRNLKPSQYDWQLNLAAAPYYSMSLESHCEEMRAASLSTLRD